MVDAVVKEATMILNLQYCEWFTDLFSPVLNQAMYNCFFFFFYKSSMEFKSSLKLI